MSVGGTGSIPLLVVVSGASGVGKDAVMGRLLARDGRLKRALTMTTRPPRDGEVSGVDYLFVTPERFEAHVAAGDLLEHAWVHTNRYGSPRARVRALLDAGYDVLLQVDVQGSLALREALPGALYVYIAPESAEILEAHLLRRGTPAAILEERRADRAAELAAARHFEHVVVNREDELEAAVDAALGLIEAARRDEAREAVVV